MAKQKVCKKCKFIFSSGDKCPKCGSEDIRDSFKGKIRVFNLDESEVAQKIKLKEKGEYAIRL